ncbi:hypothetical protein NW768_002430 [Fusarium equiseti]|uniref:Uncharacterized protein n=1 Tax=Fusarium equiseti TaxID=61235 RepID=A0ABQ8RPA9_FUSEQ|nr:hypothetical protein NW768_002430 [Fusarium equiseti]
MSPARSATRPAAKRSSSTASTSAKRRKIEFAKNLAKTSSRQIDYVWRSAHNNLQSAIASANSTHQRLAAATQAYDHAKRMKCQAEHDHDVSIEAHEAAYDTYTKVCLAREVRFALIKKTGQKNDVDRWEKEIKNCQQGLRASTEELKRLESQTDSMVDTLVVEDLAFVLQK